MATTTPTPKKVVEPGVAAEIPPVQVPGTNPSRLAHFWIATPRTLKFEDGTEITFQNNRLATSDEALIKNITAMAGDKSRLWLVNIEK